MNRIILFISIILLISCNNRLEEAKDGETIIIHNDTFSVNVDTFFVLSSNRMRPRNVLEEANPVFENLTDMGKIFFTPHHMENGDTILTRTFKRISKNEL